METNLKALYIFRCFLDNLISKAICSECTDFCLQITSFSDCSPPFMVGIFTNAADADADGDGTVEEDEDTGVSQSRGLCLNYLQKPC